VPKEKNVLRLPKEGYDTADRLEERRVSLAVGRKD